jgi:hypothetical protein
MKVTLIGLLQLKPFDENEDEIIAGSIYWNSAVMAFAIVVNALVAITGLLLVFGGSVPVGIKVCLLAIGISALIGGLEWNAGLRAKSLNTLFSTVLFTAFFSYFGHIASH